MHDAIHSVTLKMCALPLLVLLLQLWALLVLLLLLQLWALLTLFFDFCLKAYISKAAPGQAVACKGDIAETAIAPESMINSWPGRLKSSVSYSVTHSVIDIQITFVTVNYFQFCVYLYDFFVKLLPPKPDLPTVTKLKMQRLLVEEFYYLQSFLLVVQPTAAKQWEVLLSLLHLCDNKFHL